MNEEKEEIVEDNSKKEEKKSQTIQIVFLILLLLAIGALIAATVTVYKYKNMLSNPLGYNMDKFGLAYCSCQNNQGQIININSNNNPKFKLDINNS